MNASQVGNRTQVHQLVSKVARYFPEILMECPQQLSAPQR